MCHLSFQPKRPAQQYITTDFATSMEYLPQVHNPGYMRYRLDGQGLRYDIFWRRRGKIQFIIDNQGLTTRGMAKGKGVVISEI
jgi:hypothetical protein